MASQPTDHPVAQSTDQPVEPGARPHKPFPRATVLGIIGISLATALLALFFAYHQAHSVDVGIRDYTIDSSPASVTFEVDKPASRSYSCRIEVQDRDHDPIGALSDIKVPAGDHQVVQTVSIPFQGDAVAVEITDCTRT